MKMIKGLFLTFCLLWAPSALPAKMRVLTTTQDLAALAEEIGGNQVAVDFIAKGYQDPHFVEPKPSYLLKMKKADLFIEVGLELEVAWAPALLTNARNPKILPGNTGFLDASEGCEILQISSGPVDRSMGDIHPFGNPHYWLSPANGRVIAANIAKKLYNLDPDNEAAYRQNLAAFNAKLDQKEKEWRELASELKGISVITYHNSWPNFAQSFGLSVANFIEIRPGVPPSPAHVERLIRQMRAEKIPLILIEPYFDSKLPQKIARDTGSNLIVVSPSVGSKKEIKNYFDLFDHNLKMLKESAAKSGKRSL